MAEVVIVGAGIIGSAIARALLQRKIPVTLLERAVPGAESSSAAAGMLAPQVEGHAPDSAFALGLYSRSLYRGFTEALEADSGIHVAHYTDGGLVLAESEEALASLEAGFAWQSARGLRVERWDAAAVRARVPGLSGDLAGALYLPDEGQVEPRALIRALSLANQRAGAQVISGQRVRRVVEAGGRIVGLELEGDQRLSADVVVIAAGAWSGQIPGVAAPAIAPVRGQLLSVLGEPAALPFLSTASGYLVPRHDGRVLVGSTAESVGFQKGVTAAGMSKLLGTALRWWPHLGAGPVLESWSGLRPSTPDGAPLLGPSPIAGLYLASGHYRNGILQAPATAQLIAELLSGQAPSLDLAPYAPTRFAAG